MSFSANVPRFLGYPLPGNPPFLTRLDVQVNKTVKKLHLSGNEHIGEEGWKAFSKALEVIFLSCSVKIPRFLGYLRPREVAGTILWPFCVSLDTFRSPCLFGWFVYPRSFCSPTSFVLPSHKSLLPAGIIHYVTDWHKPLSLERFP